MPAACAEGLQALGVRAAFLSPLWSAWCEREVSPSHRPALVEDLRHNSRGWRGRGLPSPGAGGSGWQEGAHVSAAALHTCPRLGCLPRPRANGDPWVGSEEVAGVTIHQRPGRVPQLPLFPLCKYVWRAHCMPGPKPGGGPPGPDVVSALLGPPSWGWDRRSSHSRVENQFLCSSARPWGGAGPKMGHLGPQASGVSWATLPWDGEPAQGHSPSQHLPPAVSPRAVPSACAPPPGHS